MTPLPRAEVNRIDAAHVLAALGVARARERHKHACIECASTDALHAKPGRTMKCYSCGKHWSNIDAVMRVRGSRAAEACRWLAETFGIAAPTDFSRHAGARSTLRLVDGPASPWTQLSRLRADGVVPSHFSDVYAELIDGMTLGPLARRYLDARAIDADRAASEYGLLSIEGRRAHADVCDRLAASFTFAELAAAGCGVFTAEHEVAARSRALAPGFPADDRTTGTVHLAYPPFVPCLGIVYRHRGAVVAVRFRRLDGGDRMKYASLKGAPPLTVPYNVDALDDCSGAEVHVTEGELDALTLALRGHRAVGLPGTSVTAAMRATLAAAVVDAARVVIWVDNDAHGAGYDAAFKLWTVLLSTHGAVWMRRVQMLRPRHVKDVNALAAAGAL